MTRKDKEKHSIFQNFYRINGSDNQKKIVSSHFLQSPCSSLSVKNTITFHNRKIILSDNCSFPAKRNRYHSLSFTLSLILGYLNKLTEPKSSPVATNLLSLDRLQALRSVPEIIFIGFYIHEQNILFNSTIWRFSWFLAFIWVIEISSSIQIHLVYFLYYKTITISFESLTEHDLAFKVS